MDNEVIIEVNNLTKDYGFGRGVFDINFKVHRGECYGYLGPNGAGKSTTIRHIMGFSKPQKGEVKVFGKSSFGHTDDILGQVGYLPGEIALPQGLRGDEFLEMMGKLRGGLNQERIEFLLNQFELDPNIDTKTMSLGEKRKLAIVAAFMNDPEVLILDEPTSGLDPLMQERFIDFIKKEKKRQKTILLSSHIFSEVDACCDTISIIKDGKHVSSFVANEVKHTGKHSFKIEAEKKTIGSMLKEKAFKMERIDDNHLRLWFMDSENAEALSFLSSFQILDCEEEKFELESYFMSFYKEDKKFNGLAGTGEKN